MRDMFGEYNALRMSYLDIVMLPESELFNNPKDANWLAFIVCISTGIK